MQELVRAFEAPNYNRELVIREATILADEIESIYAERLSILVNDLERIHTLAKKDQRTIIVSEKNMRIILTGKSAPKFKGERILSWAFRILFQLLASMIPETSLSRKNKLAIRAHKENEERNLIIKASVGLKNMLTEYRESIPFIDVISILFALQDISKTDNRKFVVKGKKCKFFCTSGCVSAMNPDFGEARNA